GTLLIGQPAHARLSGRMAAAWAWPFDPRADVCLAALQHDIGMAAWDAAPGLDPAAGLPYSFTSMPRAMRGALWSRAARPGGRPERLRRGAGVDARHRPLPPLHLRTGAGCPAGAGLPGGGGRVPAASGRAAGCRPRSARAKRRPASLLGLALAVRLHRVVPAE